MYIFIENSMLFLTKFIAYALPLFSSYGTLVTGTNMHHPSFHLEELGTYSPNQLSVKKLNLQTSPKLLMTACIMTSPPPNYFDVNLLGTYSLVVFHNQSS